MLTLARHQGYFVTEGYSLKEYPVIWQASRHQFEGRCGALVHPANSIGDIELFRHGTRVQEFQWTEPGTAWVFAGGRNPGGSEYACSEYWTQSEQGWRHNPVPTAGELTTKPHSWPTPLTTMHEITHLLSTKFDNPMTDGPPKSPEDMERLKEFLKKLPGK